MYHRAVNPPSTDKITPETQLPSRPLASYTAAPAASAGLSRRPARMLALRYAAKSGKAETKGWSIGVAMSVGANKVSEVWHRSRL